MEETVQIYAPNLEGEYTMQTVSILEVYNRLKDEHAANRLPRASDLGPKYGLLSECLSPSPVIHTVFSASIRRDTDDKYVVFIGERHIEVRRLTERLSLELLVTKSDFFCKIRSAGLLDLRKGSSNGFLDRIIKQEDDDPQLSSSKSYQRTPAQVLVIALESGDLAFVYLDGTKGPKLDFVISTYRVSPELPKVSHVGKAISVDPLSRAMAVCAWEGSFRLYETQDAPTMEQKLAHGQSFIPLRHEKTFQVPGTIIHLEFLRSKEPNLVVFLVLFVNKLRQARLLLYEWNTTEPLSKAAQLGQDGLRLPEKWGIPLYIIPLTIPTFFVLILERTICVGKAIDITNGNCKWQQFPIPVASHRDNNLVTAWARPHRNADYAQRNDDFYVVKENGELFWLYVNNSQSSYGPNIETVKSGKLSGAVGKALAFHDIRTGTSGDLLVAAGEGSSGGTYLITPKRPNEPSQRDPLSIQEIFNWSPMFDVDILDFKASGRSNITSRGRLYTCTGFGEHGAVAEIRHGIECRFLTHVDYPEHVTKLIALEGSNGRGCFLILCLILGTSLWYLPYDTLDPSDVSDIVSLRIGGNVQTLTARVSDGRATQVTTNGVYSTTLNEDDVETDIQVPSPRQEWDCPPGHTIVGATLEDETVVLAIKSESGYQIWNMELQPVSNGDQDKFLLIRGDPIDIPTQPTYLDFLNIGKWVHLLVVASGTTLNIYESSSTGALILRAELSTSDSLDADGELTDPQAQSPICESVCIVESCGQSFLLCGLRNGHVLYFEIDINTLQFNQVKRLRIGRLPVLLSTREESRDRAFAHSTHSLYQLTIQKSELVVTPIVFNQKVEPSIEAFCHLNHDFRSTQFPDPVICATGSSVLIAMTSRMPMICTRQLEVKETPSKLIYNEKEDLLVVACLRPGYCDIAEENMRRIKSPNSTLLFLDPQTGTSQAPRDLKDAKYDEIIFSKPDERIHCLANWKFPDENLDWNCILVGTSYLDTETQSRKGRILVLSLKYNELGRERRLEIRKRNQISCLEPVYSVSTYGDSTIMFGSEKALSRIELVRNDKGQWKFERRATEIVSSTPVQITTQEEKNLVWISSTRDALTVYKVINEPAPTLQRLYSDDRERAGRDHLQIEENFFLATDRDDGILGLWMPPEQRTTTSLTRVMEGYLPNSIATLRAGDLRAPWKPRNLGFPGVIRPDIDIIGTCFDGAMYHFTILSEPATDLLVHLQQRYLRFTYPTLNNAPIHRKEMEMLRDGTLRHVDGGLLLQAVESEEKEWLKGAMKQDDVFVDLVIRLFRNEGDYWTSKMVIDETCMEELVIEYMKGLLGGVVL